jgi:hypothetical protein
LTWKTRTLVCHQKLLLYRAAVCPRLNWDLAINQFPISWVRSKLEASATKFLKKWVGLARPADPSRLYLPTREGGLGLPAISTLYQKQQASVASLLLTSPNPIIRHTTTLAIRKEEISADQHTGPCWKLGISGKQTLVPAGRPYSREQRLKWQ